MFTTAYRRRNARIMLILVFIGVIAGLVFALLSDGIDRPMPLINASIGGGLLGLYTALIEIRLMSPRFRRKIQFLPMMFLRIFLYTVMTVIIMLLVLSVSRVFWFGLSYSEVWQSYEFQELLRREFFIVILYAIGVTGIVVFSYQIARKIGPRYLFNMITGNYYTPRQQQLIFMFMQIDEAEAISRSLGLLSFYNFFNDIIYDITPPIVTFKAEIYQYVDNEMVFYWDPSDGLQNAACLRAYFAFCDRLYEHREKYLTNYGVYPVLKTAIHVGEVVHGEIGYGKTEIDFSGDVLNTCSRMLQNTTPENPVIISGKLKEMLDLPAIYALSPIGKISLQGKSQPLPLYQVNEKPTHSMPV